MKKYMCLLLTFLFIGCAAALAWWPEESYKTKDDLPEQIRSTLPAQECYQQGIRGGGTIYTMMKRADETYIIRIFEKRGNTYTLACESKPLPKLRGSMPGIGCGGEDVLYLSYDGGGSLYSFSRMEDGTWQLGVIQADHTIWMRGPLIFIDISGIPGGGIRVVCAHWPVILLSGLDAAALPRTIYDWWPYLDTEGCGLVNCHTNKGTTKLYASPVHGAEVLGEYFNGAPAKVVSRQRGWMNVDICGTRGWMRDEFITFGMDMLQLDRQCLDMCLLEDAKHQSVKVYARPDLSSPVTGVLDSEVKFHIDIIGIAGSDWYHILYGDGLSGFVEAKYFYEGNG